MALKPDWYLRSRLKLRHLKFLVALDEVRHQAQAAKLLATTQPGASKMLAELEAMLEVQLFERTAKGTVPTAHGEVLIRHARWILGDLDRIGDELGSLGDELSGVVYLGTNSSSAAYLVPHSLLLLHQRAPRLTVVVREESAESLLPSLASRKLDLVVARLGRATMHHDYAQTVLFDEPMVLVTAPTHPLALQRAALSWSDLQEYPWIMPPRDTPVSDGLELLLTRYRLNPSKLAESASILHNMVLISAASAIGIMPSTVALQYVKRGVLSILPLELPQIFGQIGIITLLGLEPSRAVIELIECLRETAQGLETQV